MLDQLFAEMQAEDAVGLLLAAQLHNTPGEMNIIVQSTLLDHSIGRLKAQNQYVIHLTNLAEHKLTLGLFDEIAFVETHPLLIHHNAPRFNVFIASAPESPEAVLQEIEDAHEAIMKGWRDMARDFNTMAAPDVILRTGYGFLGKMPEPIVQAVAQILARHKVQHNLIADETPLTPMKLLAIDQSYFVAAMFEIERITFESE
ncbi:MAG: hypothetical protein IT324_18585 [Anaerolineae bacterium]|nr:hypothetical protein [Anaerolineae bacterium]